MTLSSLKTLLDNAKATTDIQMVILDFLSYANITNKNKLYPMVVWDIDNLTGDRNLRATTGQSGLLKIDMYCMNLVAPENDVSEAKLGQWDAIEVDMLAYLTAVNAVATLGVKNLDAVEFEYYPSGMLSMEREMGVLYKSIELELWC